MTTTGRRFWVEVSPRFAVPPSPPSSPSGGGVPRLTSLAVAAGLEGAELDAELASVHGQRSSLAAYELGLIERKAALGARHTLPFGPVSRTDGRTGSPTSTVPDLLDEEAAAQVADDFLPEEVAVLLNASVPATRHLVDHALTLVRQFPAVWHALADQRIDESRAGAIVRALKHEAAAWGGPVADGVVDAIAACGVGWAERGCGPSALHDRLVAALIAADPAAADRRREVSKRGADAVVVGTGDGLGELRLVHVDLTDARLARAQIDAYARRLKADGDERPIGQIRVAVVLALIMRPWEARDPAVAHLTVTADLADLLLPDLEPLMPTSEHTTTDTDTETATTADADAAADSHTGTDADADADADADSLADSHADDDSPADAGPHAHVGVDAGGDDDREAHAGGDDDREAHAGARAAASAEAEASTDAEDGAEADAVARADAVASGDVGEEPSPSSRAGSDSPVGAVPGTGLPTGGSQVGHLDGQPVSPAAVKELLRRIDALGLTHPDGGHLTLTITGPDRSLLAVATPEELEAAARTGVGLGSPPATPAYRPTAAQYRYLRARDRHCRFPGCRQTALHADADHVVPYDHHHPARGGQTCVRNLVVLCRRHHQLKTHAPGWHFALDPDGTLHVTTPGGTTRSTTPPAADQVLDLLAPPPHDPRADPPPF